VTKPESAAPERVVDASAAEIPRALRSWLLARDPPAPASLLEHLDGTSATAGDLLQTLVGEATHALEDARAGAGERRGAFRLLAADAYLTYACEVALEREDATGALREVLERVVREAEGG
jgi:hypothetical protein